MWVCLVYTTGQMGTTQNHNNIAYTKDMHTCSCSGSAQFPTTGKWPHLHCAYIKQPYILSLLTFDPKWKPHATNPETSISWQRTTACLARAPPCSTNVNSDTHPWLNWSQVSSHYEACKGNNGVVKAHSKVDTQFITAAVSCNYLKQFLL